MDDSTGSRNKETIAHLKASAAISGDLEALGKILDIEQAAAPSEEPNLSGGELAKILGVPLNDEGLPVDMTEMLNACLHVQSNETVVAMPQPERIRAIRTAAALLDALL